MQARAVASLLVLLMAGCARFGEALDDRITEREPTVALACHALPSVLALHSGRSARVVASGERTINRVGPLFDWPAVPSTAIRVSVLPAQSVEGLIQDLTAMLGAPDATRLPLIVGVSYLAVESIPGRWSEVKGTICARVAFNVEGLPGAVGRRVFRGEHRMRVVYFYASDMELALQTAYCAALSRFAQCISNEPCGEEST